MEIGDWITLAAVLVALGIGVASIWHTRSMQKKERRERLLNEIIEWAADAGKPKYALNVASLSSSTVSEKDQQLFYRVGQASYIDALIVRSEYISKIASTFTQNLGTAVENLKNDLENHSQLIQDWIQDKVDAADIGKDEAVLGKSANEVLRKAAKIKTRGIS